MKKILMLVFSTAVLSSAFAQSNRQNRYDRNYNNQQVYNNDISRNSYRLAERDRQIQRISSQYDYRIQQIAYDRSLNKRRKEIAIRNLQAQKAREINLLYSQYNSNAYNNRSYGQYNR